MQLTNPPGRGRNASVPDQTAYGSLRTTAFRIAAALVMLTGAGMLAAGPASAATGRAWSVSASPDVPLAQDSLSAVSCPAAGHCVALGTSVTASGNQVPLVKTWDGHAWTVQHVPVPAHAAYPALSAISCTSARYCVAVGQYRPRITSYATARLAERWNGRTWTIVLRTGAGGLDAVSCAAYNACTAVGATNVDTGNETSSAVAERWNGKGWTSQRVPSFGGPSGIEFTGVACTSARSCITVGYNDDFGDFTNPISARWNGRRWSPLPISAPTPNGETESIMGGLSCFSARACTALGYSTDPGGDAFYGLAERWNGRRWGAQTLPDPVAYLEFQGMINGISCPSARTCVMVAGQLTLRWDGAAWAILTTATTPAGGSLDGISCRSAVLCTAVGAVSEPDGRRLTLAARWNGSAWAAQPTPGNPAGAQPNRFTAVSCSASRACEAVGSAGDRLLSASWNGTRWFVHHSAEPAGAASVSLSALSCAGGTCVAVGSLTVSGGSPTALAEAWNGSSWSLLPVPAGVTGLSGISCPAATACVAVGSGASGPVADSWNGAAWTAQTLAVGPTSLTAVSCSAASACMAVGVNGTGPAAEYWNGSGWTDQTPLAGHALSAVSCPRAGDCTAVGLDGTADRWNGATWSAQKSATARADLTGISCVSSSACMAVGGYHSNAPFLTPLVVEHWDGSQWVTQRAASPGGSTGNSLEGVSCASAAACLAVGENRDSYYAWQTLAERYG